MKGTIKWKDIKLLLRVIRLNYDIGVIIIDYY